MLTFRKTGFSVIFPSHWLKTAYKKVAYAIFTPPQPAPPCRRQQNLVTLPEPLRWFCGCCHCSLSKTWSFSFEPLSVDGIKATAPPVSHVGAFSRHPRRLSQSSGIVRSSVSYHPASCRQMSDLSPPAHRGGFGPIRREKANWTVLWQRLGWYVLQMVIWILEWILL